jgi:hypothetical protein
MKKKTRLTKAAIIIGTLGAAGLALRTAVRHPATKRYAAKKYWEVPHSFWKKYPRLDHAVLKYSTSLRRPKWYDYRDYLVSDV